MTRLVEVCFSTLPLSLGQYVNFFGVQKILQRFFNLFSSDASVHYRDANCRKKVLGVVLNNRSVSRQTPFCVFDEHYCLIYDLLSLNNTQFVRKPF